MLELVVDTMEFGGLRLLPSDDMDRTEPLVALDALGMTKNLEVAEDDAVLLLLLILDSLSLALRCASGIPSHFELTLGTLAGSFWGETDPRAIEFPIDPFSEASFRCCSANSSRAECEGSFKAKNPSTPFFFFFGAFESFDEEALEARLAVLEPPDVLLRSERVLLLGSKFGRAGDDALLELGVDSRWSAVVSLDGVLEDEVWAEESDSWSAGR
jgi:hypothetical protein